MCYNFYKIEDDYMMRKGFTLAEILVAMAVVGVVSSLVIPQVVSNVENQKIGLQVARTVEQVEVGCQNYLRKNESSNFTLLSEAFAQNNVGSTSSTREYALRRYVGMMVNTNGPSLTYDNGLTLNGSGDEKKMIAYEIDANGTSKTPNSYGRDKFIFYLNNSCRMVPHGADGMKYKTDCDPKTGITDYKTCAARLVRDGYKINY